MKRKNKKELYLTIVLLIALVIGVGYAYLTSNLSITGSTEIANNTWDIHFENVQINENSVAIETGYSAAVVNPSDNTEVTYSVKLNRPGDFYEFTVDVKNYGTIDGMIESLTSTLSINNAEPFAIASNKSNLPAYLDYDVTYSDGLAIENNHELKVGEKETYKVRVEFKKDITSEQLPKNNPVSLLFNLRPKMVQADENAVNPHPVPTAASVISAKYNDGTNSEGLILVNTNEYRYSGSTVNNYVNFNGEIWRIIGVIDGRIKLLRNEVLTSNTNIQEYAFSSGEKLFENSKIDIGLNGKYLTDTGFLGSSLSEEAQNLIDSVDWHNGEVNYNNKTSDMYNIELNGATVNRKVGLIYPSDYGYASSGCYNSSTYLVNYNNNTCKNSNWMISDTMSSMGIGYWTIFGTINYQSICGVSSNGNIVGFATGYSGSPNKVRPSVYLKPSVKLASTSGDGSSELKAYVFESDD